MDKLKTMMQTGDKEDAENSTGPTGRLTGQGSHFPKSEEQPVGAATTPQGNVITGDTLGAQKTHAVTPATGLVAPSSGIAAIGETSTYSSHTLRTGDPVPNIVDSRSEDPTTYRAPEHSYVSSKGVPEGGPLAAAALAFHKDKDYSTSHIPGAFPKDTTAHDATTIAPPHLTSTTSPAERSAVYSEAEKTKVPDAAAAAQYATRAAPGTQDPVSEEPRRSGTIGKILGAVGLGTAAGGAVAATSRAEENQPHAIADTHDQPTTTTGVDSYTSPSRSGAPPSHHRKESIPTTAYPAGVDSPAPINAPVGGTSYLTDQDEKDHAGRNAGLAAGAAGVGAGAAAAGVYAMKDREKDTTGSDLPLRENSTAAAPAAAAVPASESAARTTPSSQTAKQPSVAHEATPAAAGASIVPNYSQHQDKLEAQAQKHKAQQEATRAGAASIGGGASVAPEYTEQQNRVSEETDRQRRNREKEAALAGVAGAGVGATGLHEYNQRQDTTERDAQRQKDLAEQEAARQKQFEKDQKAAEKLAKKEEKQHQKELKKEEKQHQKELEREEKQHQKELEKEEKARDKVAEKEEKQHRDELEREQKDREKAAATAAAGAGVGAAAGAGAYEVHEKDKHPPPTTATDDAGRTKLHKEPEEKKPGLLKRIFKRRKNKDTGEEEEYEDHEHEPEPEHGDHHLAAAGVAGGTGAAVAGTAAAASHEPPATSYEAQSGGLQKPSYNPFSKDDPAHEHATASNSGAAQPRKSSVGPDAIDPATTHVPYDPVHDPSSRKSVSEQGGRIDQIGGLTAHHQYAEGEQKPGLAHRIIDALKPLPDREELQHHAEQYHHNGTSHQPGTAQ
ncbi:hypothetical protein AYL99_00073 [Fonsecaea erecta]|uniref:Uncharacterized protein n=1 Tax=Fonsecaea erecta TaxID=1367422 RepID=A0A178ZXE4_9EURO|nr:hypothetical protein AYL99_00073 [Fonsecaea erecta]OAP64101.1 hypothetical protein AYL99_00073 [Fonsecaea erecta]